MPSVKIGFGVDALEQLAELVGVDTRPARMRLCLEIQAKRGIPFETAWKASQRVLQGDNRAGDGDWYATWKFAKPYYRASYEHDLAAWERLTAAARAKQAAEATLLAA